MPDWVINLIYFLLGLALAVLGVIQNHYYYVKQQQDKFDRISGALDDISKRLATLESTISEQRLEQILSGNRNEEVSTKSKRHLTRREADILRLIFGDGLNFKEAATQMGINEFSLRTHVASLQKKGIILRGRQLTPIGQQLLEEIQSQKRDEQNE
jgi:DNA-binding CsgD family transcriptional regulator